MCTLCSVCGLQQCATFTCHFIRYYSAVNHCKFFFSVSDFDYSNYWPKRGKSECLTATWVCSNLAEQQKRERTHSTNSEMSTFVVSMVAGHANHHMVIKYKPTYYFVGELQCGPQFQNQYHRESLQFFG